MRIADIALSRSQATRHCLHGVLEGHGVTSRDGRERSCPRRHCAMGATSSTGACAKKQRLKHSDQRPHVRVAPTRPQSRSSSRRQPCGTAHRTVTQRRCGVWSPFALGDCGGGELVGEMGACNNPAHASLMKAMHACIHMAWCNGFSRR